MAVQGLGVSDFAKLAEFTWIIYHNVWNCSKNFRKLGLDVECLLISVSALNKVHTVEGLEG